MAIEMNENAPHASALYRHCASSRIEVRSSRCLIWVYSTGRKFDSQTNCREPPARRTPRPAL